MAVECRAFTDYLSRKSEHLDEDILKDITPTATLIGAVETGQFKAEDGVSHTFDRFNRVFPDMSAAWSDITSGACVGQPCDPTVQKIGMGFTRDSYKLQSIDYGTDLFCYDQIMSADRAKKQFANTIETLRDATQLINDNRIRNEMFRIAGYHWLCTMTGLTPFTFTETGDLITVTTNGNAMPTSKLVVNMLRSRLQNQILSGALGKTVKGSPMTLEVLTDMDTIWDLIQGDSALADHWRFQEFEPSSKEFYQYGWVGRVGNFMLKADLHPQRFNINLVTNKLERVFPYLNIAATQGIKGVVNPAYIIAPVQAHYIWHRRAMKVLARKTTPINPMMPFAAQDFGGKWQFVMDNMTCPQEDGSEIPVNNELRNKGKFRARFAYATEAQYPEFAEVFLALRETPGIVGNPGCAVTTAYPAQSYSSTNSLCA